MLHANANDGGAIASIVLRAGAGFRVLLLYPSRSKGVGLLCASEGGIRSQDGRSLLRVILLDDAFR